MKTTKVQINGTPRGRHRKNDSCLRHELVVAFTSVSHETPRPGAQDVPAKQEVAYGAFPISDLYMSFVGQFFFPRFLKEKKHLIVGQAGGEARKTFLQPI